MNTATHATHHHHHSAAQQGKEAPTSSLNRLAVSATLHCLTGCAIGEVLGLVIAMALGWGTAASIVLAILLAFVFGYGFTLVPLVKGGMAWNKAASIATTATSVGPAYIFRNVWNRAQMYAGRTDTDDRQPFFKSGGQDTLGYGRRYVFHNTMLQAVQSGLQYPLGAGGVLPDPRQHHRRAAHPRRAHAPRPVPLRVLRRAGRDDRPRRAAQPGRPPLVDQLRGVLREVQPPQGGQAPLRAGVAPARGPERAPRAALAAAGRRHRGRPALAALPRRARGLARPLPHTAGAWPAAVPVMRTEPDVMRTEPAIVMRTESVSDPVIRTDPCDVIRTESSEVMRTDSASTA